MSMRKRKTLEELSRSRSIHLISSPQTRAFSLPAIFRKAVASLKIIPTFAPEHQTHTYFLFAAASPSRILTIEI